MACRLVGAKPLSEPMLEICQLDPWDKIFTSSFRKIYLKMSSAKWRPFCLGLNVLMLLTKAATSLRTCSAIASLTHIHVYQNHMEWSSGMYTDVMMGTLASQIIGLTIVYSTAHPDADQRKYQSSASLAFVQGIHWPPVNSLHKGPVTVDQ